MAIPISIAIVALQYLLWLSIVGHDSWTPLLARCGAALLLSVWVGARRLPIADTAKAFAAFEAPQLLGMTGIAGCAIVARPSDPANLPFLGALLGLHLLDLVCWFVGWGAIRLLQRRRALARN